jgi:hypothetical protein
LIACKTTPSKTTLPWGSRNSIPASDATRVSGLTGIYTTTNGDTLGEGSYVEFVAYILESHFGGAESVNCNETTRRNIEFHLALVTQRPWTLPLSNYDTECSSVTAEIISHRRPIDWEILGRMAGTGRGQKLIGAQSKLKDEDLLQTIDAEHARLEATQEPVAVTAQKILELAKKAEILYKSQKPTEQRRLLETVLSNCTFDRGTLCPTYSSPFDLLVKGNETGNWRRERDSNPVRCFSNLLMARDFWSNRLMRHRLDTLSQFS